MEERSLLRKALFYLSRPTCVCCKEPLDVSDFAFCPECSVEFKERLNNNCSFCTKDLRECDCAPEFLRAHFIKKLYKSIRYIGTDADRVSAALIYSLKRRSRSDVLHLAAELMLESLSRSGEDFSKWTFTNVPRRGMAVTEYGFDHAAYLAKTLAKKLGADYKPLLRSRSKREQKQLSREERMKNADFILRKSSFELKGKVIIVDDVVTTGASMGTAATLIRGLGIKEIRGLTLAVSYPDT